jgi:hypothetical protein
MSLSRHIASGLFCLLLLAAAARADQSASPLRLMPDKADFVIEIPQARQLIEAVTTLDALKQLEQLGVAKELLNSTQYRRFYQLVAYFEKELGAKWPELLDRLAGKGAALGVKFGPDPAPALLVIEGKDEKLMGQFVKLALQVLEQEIARQEGQDKLVKEKYEDIETYHLGQGFHAAQVGAALVLSNNRAALKVSLDLHLGKEKNSAAALPAVADAHKLLPQNPLVTFWLNMEAVRDTEQGKEFYKRPRDLNQTILFGGLIDVLSRTPYVTGGLYKEEDGFLTTIRMPQGREGMGPEALLHLPPEGQGAGTLPLLSPRGVIFSDSSYLNVSRIWEDRKEFMGEKDAKSFEDLDKRSGQFLSGIKISKLLQDAGTHHRVVVVNQPKVGYKTKPKVSIPAFAVVTEMRDPEAFSKSVSTVLRGAGLLYSTTQTKVELVEEKVGGTVLVGYRFPDSNVYKQDANDLRFNFSPCFARVGNQLMVCSTLELGREIVGILENEAAGKVKVSGAVMEQRFYSAGAADVLAATEEQLVTQLILDQAVPPDDAKAQVREFINIIRRLGDANLQVDYRKNEYRFELRIKTTK